MSNSTMHPLTPVLCLTTGRFCRTAVLALNITVTLSHIGTDLPRGTSMVDSDDTSTTILDDEERRMVSHVRYAVRMTDVCRVYRIGKREVVALKNINLEVTPGEYVVISGHSGSGKTTLLNLIGVIDYPTSGRVIVMDVPIGDYDESFRAAFRLYNTGFVFQSYNLVSTLTALENVMFPMQLSEQPLAEVQERAMRLLERVGLSDRHDHLPWQLSSGEQQRVAVARAIANDPPIVLADEPTANLDSESAEMIRELLTELNNQKKTVFVMTHDEKIINRHGVRRFEMIRGELVSHA